MPPVPHTRACLAALILALTPSVFAPSVLADEYHPPGGTAYAHTSGDVTILPGGRALKPLGSQIELGPGAFGLAISPKGLIGVSETGFERFGLSVLEPHKDTWKQNLLWAVPTEDLDPNSRAAKQPDRWLSASYGIAFDSEKSVWIAEGDSGKIRLLDVSSGARRKIVSIDDSAFHDSYTADLAIDPVRHILYVLDQAHFRMVLIDTVKDTILASVATGRMPFTMALSPDRNTMYVASVGMYRYQVLPSAGLPFPAFGFLSPEAMAGVVRQLIQVPPPGNPNDNEVEFRSRDRCSRSAKARGACVDSYRTAGGRQGSERPRPAGRHGGRRQRADGNPRGGQQGLRLEFAFRFHQRD